MLVSPAQTSSPSASFPSSDSTTEGLTTPDGEQAKNSRDSSSILTRSPTTALNTAATTNVVPEVKVTTKNPETSTITVLTEPTTEDLMQYSSAKLTEKSVLEIRTSERTTGETLRPGTTEGYSTEVETRIEERTTHAPGIVSTESYSTQSENKPRLPETSETLMEQTSMPESTESPFTMAIEEKSSQAAKVQTTPAVGTTESHSTTSVEKSIFGTTHEPSHETSQSQTKEDPSTVAVEGLITSTGVKGSQPVSTEIYWTYSENKPMAEVTTISLSDMTSQRHTVESLSTEAGEIVRLEATSESTDTKTSQPVSTNYHSTMSEEKSKLEQTSLSLVDKTTAPGTTEESSTKASEEVILETTSQGDKVGTYEPGSTERYSTDSENNQLLQATTQSPTDERIVSTETTNEPSIHGTSKSQTMEGPSTMDVEGPMLETTSVTDDVRVSLQVSTATYLMNSDIKPMAESTSMSPIDATSQPHMLDGLSTKTGEIIRLEATSESTNTKTSHPVSMDSRSTMSEEKFVLERTSLSSVDKTTALGTKEESSTKASEEVIMETTSQGDKVGTYEPGSTERYTTDSENNQLLQATTQSPIDERRVSTDGHSTGFDSETSQSLITETSKPVITEGFPTKIFSDPVDEVTKGPVEQEMYTSEPGKKESSQ